MYDMHGWISVDDRLPKNCDLVVIIGEWDGLALAGYQKYFEAWFDDEDREYEPFYWMPIPPHPSER